MACDVGSQHSAIKANNCKSSQCASEAALGNVPIYLCAVVVWFFIGLCSCMTPTT